MDSILNVNGREHRLSLDPRVTLLDALRETMGLTGTKKGCDQGQCGACTVLVGGVRVLSCFVLAGAVNGAVTTIEGLSGEDGALHPMQQAFIDCDAYQCGYCTPGQIMSAVACIHEGHAGNEDDIREYMSGNICRCAAYPKIVQAVNYAIDRKALLAQGGYLAGKRTDQILPPGMAGFRDASLYPLKGPDIATAKKWLAKAGVKDGTGIEFYTSNRGASPLQAQIVQFNLKQIGLNVNSHLFARAVQIDKEGTRGEPFDITSEGWIADYADPYDFINVLLSGDNLHDSNNNNVAYFNDPKYNKAMTAASLMSGAARYKAYGNLDVNMMKDNPPWAARNNFNDRILLSAKVGCFTYNSIYSVDLAAACIK